MRSWLVGGLVAAGLCLPSWAQGSKRFIQAELLKTTKAKKAKVGDQVKARAVNAVILPGGVTISEGTILLGEVRAADSNSLAISFDQAELNGKKKPLSLSIRAAMMPGGPRTHGDAGNSPLDVSTSNEHPIHGATAPLPEKTKPASERSTGSSGVSEPGRNVAAQTGSVIGMPGVTLEVDESPQHASKFASTGKELELKGGLQLMLAVVE